MIIETLSLIFIGICVALLSSFIGFGGGTIIVPLLPFFTGMDIKSTIATSLTIVALNASNNSYNFHRKSLINWKLVLTMALGSLIFGFLSSKITSLISDTYSRWSVIGVFVALAYITFAGPKKVPQFLRESRFRNQVIVGIFAGITSGLGGIGGGTFVIPILLIGRWVENQRVAPTGNALNMLTAGVAAVTLAFSNGEINWKAVVIILTTSMIGSHFARKVQHTISEHKRRYAVGIFLIFAILLQVYSLVRV